MNKIYCIASGEYSDWCIDYAFKSKDKRDNLLSILNEAYFEYDLELNDDEIDIEDVKVWYFISIYKNFDDEIYFHSSQYTNLNPILIKNNKTIAFSGEDDLCCIKLAITEEEYNRGAEYYRHKYEKIWYDTKSKIKYMRDVEGLMSFEIKDIY